MSGADDLETLGRRLARHRRALERNDHVDPDSLEELTTSIHRRLLEPLAAEVEPRALLTLLDEAEALRDALARAHRAARASMEAGDRRRRGQAAYRSATRT